MEGIIQTAVIILNLSDIIQNNSNEIYYVFLDPLDLLIPELLHGLSRFPLRCCYQIEARATAVPLEWKTSCPDRKSVV